MSEYDENLIPGKGEQEEEAWVGRSSDSVSLRRAQAGDEGCQSRLPITGVLLWVEWPPLVPESFPIIGWEQSWEGVASEVDAAEVCNVWQLEDVHQPAFLWQVLLKDLSITPFTATNSVILDKSHNLSETCKMEFMSSPT